MITTIFMNNRTQAVRLPNALKFSEEVQKVHIRQVGVERVLSPVDQLWDSFFTNDHLQLSADFERGEQIESTREELF